MLKLEASPEEVHAAHTMVSKWKIARGCWACETHDPAEKYIARPIRLGSDPNELADAINMGAEEDDLLPLTDARFVVCAGCHSALNMLRAKRKKARLNRETYAAKARGENLS